ncbi:TetR family transcriptional regulator [Bifidobacterium sp. MA2]|uniref:TetR family transcriptional regulator n=1 Tax=Bifidobacterium santillanense TaxID=2809028 RepID=A0ABS5UM96_9BIFI|nr:TetR/AcrR family transcriptional regulator [Bifidobacterium santillanense]MBT1172025.1 TetR family transcriptional regulator [Bifidobacterium santillanense]
MDRTDRTDRIGEGPNTGYDRSSPASHPTGSMAADRRLATLHRNNEESNAFVRECIEGALIRLMETKPFDRISVSDIARLAGVSRNAYYRNYSSKEDILTGFLDTVFTAINASLLSYDPMTQTREAWLALLDGVSGIAQQYRLILKAGQGDRIRERMESHMNRGAARNRIGPTYAACYWAGAICAVVDRWVLDGMAAPKEEIADVMTDLMLRGVATADKYGTGCVADTAVSVVRARA